MIVDPGVGFAKRPAHSYGVLARLPELGGRLDRPVLVGPSRKSFMRGAVGGRPGAERDWGTAAAVTAAVLAGAHIVRVHAVAEMVQVVRVAEEIRSARRLSTWTHGHEAEPAFDYGLVDRSAAPTASGWWDLVDILVVSILIYEVLKLIRGTRAVQMALGAAVFVGAVLRLALGPPRDRQLADSQPVRLRGLRGHRAVSVRHPPRARASRPGAVLPLLREGRVGRGVDRRAGRRGEHAVGAADRRDHRDRAADRACATTSKAAFRSTRC